MQWTYPPTYLLPTLVRVDLLLEGHYLIDLQPELPYISRQFASNALHRQHLVLLEACNYNWIRQHSTSWRKYNINQSKLFIIIIIIIIIGSRPAYLPTYLMFLELLSVLRVMMDIHSFHYLLCISDVSLSLPLEVIR